jgi:hypothetical protein
VLFQPRWCELFLHAQQVVIAGGNHFPMNTIPRWREPRIRAAGLITGTIAAGFGAGFAIEPPAVGTLVGTLVGAGLATFVLASASGGISARRTDPTT